MKTKRIKKLFAFTLIELIIVIAIISLLAAIVLVAVNPVVVFQKTRNSNRASDIGTIQGAISRYLSESPISGTTPRTLKDLSGYVSLYASSTASSPQGNCPGGINGTGLSTLTTAYTLDSVSTTQNSILLTPLINGGYLNNVPQDPKTQTSYQACIDTTNGNQMVIYASGIENNASIPVSSLGIYNPTVLVWDSFNRADTVSGIGTADSGQTWATTNSGAGYAGINSNTMVQNQPGSNTSLIDSGVGNGYLKTTIVNNLAGNYGVLFRASNANTFWYFGPNGSAQFQLIKIVNNVQTFNQGTGVNTTGGGNLNTYGTMEVIYSGQTITCKFNGVTLLTYIDTLNFNLSSTQVGLYTYGGNFWDNFTVTKP